MNVLCATKRCDEDATTRITMRDTAGELWTANVCDQHCRHHQEVDRLLRRPAYGKTATSTHPEWRLVSAEPLYTAPELRDYLHADFVANRYQHHAPKAST